MFLLLFLVVVIVRCNVVDRLVSCHSIQSGLTRPHVQIPTVLGAKSEFRDYTIIYASVHVADSGIKTAYRTPVVTNMFLAKKLVCPVFYNRLVVFASVSIRPECIKQMFGSSGVCVG